MLNCLMYKLSYYRFGDLKVIKYINFFWSYLNINYDFQLDFRTPAGFDRTRNAVIGNQNFDLTYLEEAYTTEHWLVRIYRVKKPDEFNRPRIPIIERKIRNPGASSISKKVCNLL